MSEKQTKKNQNPEQLADTLLVLDEEKKKIQAVKEIDKNGKLETVAPTKRNQNQFMRVDKHGDFVTNFLSNFWNQVRNPTDFKFFKVNADEAIEKANVFRKQVKSPTTEGKKIMDNHEVKPNVEQINKNQNNMKTAKPTSEKIEYRFQPDQIDWETMNNLGLSKEYLENKNLLDPLLRGYKTNELVSINMNLGGAMIRTDARLSLQTAKDGNIVAAVHGVRREPNLNYEFFGHQFTDEDKKNLLQTGNMGRVVDLKNLKTGEMMPSIISVDRLTNELIALKTEYMKIPDEIKGIKLNKDQKETLMEGKPLFIEGMISTKGTSFDAKVQYNADKRYVEFLFDRGQNNRQNQTTQQTQGKEAPKNFRGKELTEEQYNKFKDGQTIYLDNLVDKKGQTYQGYVTFNKESGKASFEFPNQYKERIKPTEAHKTQTAVNSEGKTNEATKKIKEPLKKGQQTPKNKKQKEQQSKPKAPAKSKGRKM